MKYTAIAVELFPAELSERFIWRTGKTFGFEIKVGEYLNLERYDEPTQRYPVEAIDGEWIKWKGETWHAEDIEKLEKKHVDQGCKIE